MAERCRLLIQRRARRFFFYSSAACFFLPPTKALLWAEAGKSLCVPFVSLAE
jgi:hypothetical protein